MRKWITSPCCYCKNPPVDSTVSTVDTLRSYFWCNLHLRMRGVGEAMWSYQNPELLICIRIKAYFHYRYHSRFQVKACITSPSAPHHISSGRKTMTKSSSNTDAEFSKSFDWQRRRAQLVAGKEAAHSKYLPVPNFPNIWLAQLGPQMTSFAMQTHREKQKTSSRPGYRTKGSSVLPKGSCLLCIH